MTVERQAWRAQAKCRDFTGEQADAMFFIGKGKSPKAAKQFCADCPVRQKCLEYSLVHNDEGLWAGYTQAERRALSPLVGIEFLEHVIAAGELETRNSDYWFNDDVIFGRAS